MRCNFSRQSRILTSLFYFFSNRTILVQLLLLSFLVLGVGWGWPRSMMLQFFFLHFKGRRSSKRGAATLNATTNVPPRPPAAAGRRRRRRRRLLFIQFSSLLFFLFSFPPLPWLGQEESGGSLGRRGMVFFFGWPFQSSTILLRYRVFTARYSSKKKIKWRYQPLGDP